MRNKYLFLLFTTLFYFGNGKTYCQNQIFEIFPSTRPINISTLETSNGYILFQRSPTSNTGWPICNNCLLINLLSPNGHISNSFELNNGNNNLIFYKAIKTFDNNYLLTGSTFQNYSFLIKLDSTLNIIWSKSISLGTAGFSVTNIHETYNSDILLIGYSTNPNYGSLVKLDFNGNGIWAKSFHYLPDYEKLVFASADMADNYYFIASTYSANTKSFFKVDNNGNLLWAKQFFRTVYPQNPLLYDIHYDQLNNELLFSTQNGLIKTDTAGNVLWDKAYVNSIGFDYFSINLNSHARIFKRNNNYLTIGNNWDLNGIFLNQFDLSGNPIDAKVYAWNSNLLDTINDVRGLNYFITSNSELFCAGNYIHTAFMSNNSYAYYFKTDSLLNLNCHSFPFSNQVAVSNQYSSVNVSFTSISKTITTSAMPVILNSINIPDTLICNSTGISEIINVESRLNIYSNPNNGTFNISFPSENKTTLNGWLIVYDESGKEICRYHLLNTHKQKQFELPNSTKGTYVVKLMDGLNVYSGKMIVN